MENILWMPALGNEIGTVIVPEYLCDLESSGMSVGAILAL